ncbi:MAG TPA: hypothetical protein VKS03_08740 [Thermoanaerobaculia bacterium]|nr:hypothetical protein [Thermoanaerobaculia bacterium]
MKRNVHLVLAWTGVLAIAASGCASMRGREQAPNPTAQRVQSQQQQSEQALKQASEAQKRASDQERRAAQAQDDVRKAQQALIQAQQKARQEQARAEQMQQEANRLTQQAAQQASQSQQQATRSLSQQGREVRRGRLTASGEVIAVSGTQLVLQPQASDKPMTFQVTGQTAVRIDGKQASATDIQQGEDVRVSYEATGSTQPEALSIDVSKGGAGRPQRSESDGSPPAPTQ